MCGLPNISSGYFDDTLETLHTLNSFSSLDTDVPCPSTSTPLKQNQKSHSAVPQKLKILNINFQSIVNKVSDFHCLVDTERPDIIIGTESWLSAEIKDNEIFPPGYIPFRADRESKTTRSGGVFILVSDMFVCTEQPQLKTKCEIVWVKLEIVGSQPLYIAAYYKPKEDDQDSLDMLRSSLDKLLGKKGNILVLGDFNLPKFSWVECEPSIKPDCTCRAVYDSFLDILDDFNLVQMVTEPTRQDNILDLVLVSNPTLVPMVTCTPGLSDHDIVCVEAAVRPTQTKQKRRKIYLYNKADWTTFRSEINQFQEEFLTGHQGKSVEQLWSELTEKIDQLTDKCIPSKVIKGKPSLPWISREIKTLIHRRNRLCKAYRKNGNPQLREKYVSLRHIIRKK
ncbi:MAG: hypothetical protein JAZ03_23820, partial [Candidatus Thiodiazotropha taylori]|nr:hypothetical protein [Candidatus Thiodiazotropha taylori]MCW4336962.1 hypothetical protein [Candidatus Thiodiazotropha endolucinida]